MRSQQHVVVDFSSLNTEGQMHPFMPDKLLLESADSCCFLPGQYLSESLGLHLDYTDGIPDFPS